ncbi:MAG: hypothetical protein J0L94_01190 [Rhodothermia bacterium]|nr:hypothetical protein [Rhodothermia bacterium]
MTLPADKLRIEFKALTWAVYEDACIRLGLDPTETLTTITSLSAEPNPQFMQAACVSPPPMYDIDVACIALFEWLRLVQRDVQHATSRAIPLLSRLPRSEGGDRTITGVLARMEPADEDLFRAMPLQEFLYRMSLRSAYATLDALKKEDDTEPD